MTIFLNHKYRLTLEVPAPPAPKQVVTVGTATDVVITDLQIKGTVKGSKGDAATSNLTLNIYNLSDATVNLISQEDVIVKLEVGYSKDDLKLLFLGNLLQVSTSNPVGRDRVTSIIAIESLSNIREADTNRSWTHDVTVERIFRDIIASDLKLAAGSIHNGNLSSTEGIKKVMKKFSITGNSKTVLDDLASGHELDWNITDGRVNVYPKGSGKSADGSDIPHYTSKTGLIRSPNRTVIHADKVKGSKDSKVGKTLEVILNPALTVGSAVSVDSRSFTGQIIIKEITHAFDYWKGKWTSNIVGEDKVA